VLSDTSSDGHTSSNTLFQLEHLDSSSGELVVWEDAVLRVRHIGTGLFLAAKTVPVHHQEARVGDRVQYFDVYLTSVYSDPNTVFRLEPMYSEQAEGYVKINSSFRLKSVVNNAYLHSLPEYWDEHHDSADEHNQMIGSTERFQERIKMQLCSKALDEDSLVLVRVRDDEMANINTVKAVVEPLISFYRKFDEGKVPDKSHTLRVQRILRDLIYFVQIIPEGVAPGDPMTLEEPAHEAAQKVLKEQGVIDILFEILRAPFDTKNGTRVAPIPIHEIMKNPDFKVLFLICQLCYRLLKQVIKDNDECERYLSRPAIVDFMQEQLGYQLKTADTLMELFRDNRYLLDRLSDKHINVFFDLIRDVGKLSRYMASDSRFQQFSIVFDVNLLFVTHFNHSHLARRIS
jgi:hypothetical protein